MNYKFTDQVVMTLRNCAIAKARNAVISGTLYDGTWAEDAGVTAAVLLTRYAASAMVIISSIDLIQID